MRKLAAHYRQPPDRLTEPQVRIRACRTGPLGTVHYACPGYGEQFLPLAKTATDTPVLPARRCGECSGQLRVVAIFPRRSSAIHDTR